MSQSDQTRFRAITLNAHCPFEDDSRAYQLFLASWAATIATYTCSSTVEFLYARAHDDGLGTKEDALQATVTSNLQIADIAFQVLDDVGCGKFNGTRSTSISIQQQIASDDEWELKSSLPASPRSSDSSEGDYGIRSPVPRSKVCGITILKEVLSFIVADRSPNVTAFGFPLDG